MRSKPTAEAQLAIKAHLLKQADEIKDGPSEDDKETLYEYMALFKSDDLASEAIQWLGNKLKQAWNMNENKKS